MSIHYGPRNEYEILNFVSSGAAVTFTNNNSISVDMNKTSGGYGWDTQAYCLKAFMAPCTIEFNKTANTYDDGVSYTMIGWNTDPLTDASYSSIDHAAYPFMQNTYYVYNNGSGSTYAAWDATKKFYIVYDTDGYIRHYNGSTLLYSANYGTGNIVFIDSSFYVKGSANGKLSNVRAIRRAWNGTQYKVT